MSAGAAGSYEFNSACGCDWCANGGKVPPPPAGWVKGCGWGYGNPHLPPAALRHGRTLLCIMHARRIPECIESLEALDCDKAWMAGYTDAELGEVHERLVAKTDYDWYVTISDDCVVTQAALDAVVGLLRVGHPAVTGWCRLHVGSPLVNLSTRPLLGAYPSRQGYAFPRFDDVASDPRPVIPTYFMGLSLTGMPRKLWQRFPHRAFTEIRVPGRRPRSWPRGYSSDFNLCSRLRDAGVPMVAARGGYVEHLKVVGRKPASHELLVGRMRRGVRVEVAA